jgi:hypothetical protein
MSPAFSLPTVISFLIVQSCICILKASGDLFSHLSKLSFRKWFLLTHRSYDLCRHRNTACILSAGGSIDTSDDATDSRREGDISLHVRTRTRTSKGNIQVVEVGGDVAGMISCTINV